MPGNLSLKMNQISKIKSASKVQMSTTWVSLEHAGRLDLLVPFGGSGAAVPPRGVHLLQRLSLALLFVLQKTPKVMIRL